LQTTRCYLYLFLAISFISIGASANDLITTQMPSFVLKDNLQGVDGLDNPRDITLSKDKKWAFVVSADDNSLSVFKVNPDFSLSHRQTIKSSDKIKLEGALSVVSDDSGQNIYVLSYYHSALLHFNFSEQAGLVLQHTLSDNLPFTQVFKQPDTIKPEQDALGILGGYELAINHNTNQLFIAATVSHGVSVFNTNPDGKPILSQRIHTDKDTALSGAVSVATDQTGQILAVAGMNGKAVSVYKRNKVGKFHYYQTLKHRFDMPISVTFAENGKYLIAVDAINSDIVLAHKNHEQTFEVVKVLSKAEHGIEGLNKVTLSRSESAILTFSEQSHRIDEFQINEASLMHSRKLRPSELNSATALEFLDSIHAVSTWAKSDAIAVFELITE
jgi:6-phosphogluconolactonase (cycloisomerase 2 family)